MVKFFLVFFVLLFLINHVIKIIHWLKWHQNAYNSLGTVSVSAGVSQKPKSERHCVTSKMKRNYRSAFTKKDREFVATLPKVTTNSVRNANTISEVEELVPVAGCLSHADTDNQHSDEEGHQKLVSSNLTINHVFYLKREVAERCCNPDNRIFNLIFLALHVGRGEGPCWGAFVGASAARGIYAGWSTNGNH